MKKTISFEKKIEFPSMIGEITAISLEHNLKFVDSNNIEGNFLVSGSYKLTEASRIEEYFNYELPTDIILTEKIELDTAKIEIEDFYYEIENDYTLICYIDVKIEGVEIIDIKEEPIVQQEPALITKESEDLSPLTEIDLKLDELEKDNIRECDGESIDEILEKETEEKEMIETKNTNVSSLFENINESEETYSTYSVYILREEETINSLIEKYKTTKDELESYNDLSNLSIGSKIIIPMHSNEN